MGYYRKKMKKFKFFRDSYLALPFQQMFIPDRTSYHVTGKQKINFYNKEFQKENALKFSLPLTSRCRFDSLVPYGVRSVKQTFDFGDKDFHNFLCENDVHKPLDDQFLLSYQADAGWETAREDVLGFCKPIDHTITKDDVLNAIDELGDVVIPILEKPSKEDVKLEYVNDKSYSGLLTSMLSGHNKKQSLPFSIFVAEYLYDYLGSRFTPDTSIKTVAGVRPRMVDSSKFYEFIKSRSAIQEEAPVSQLKQIYFRRVTEFFKEYNSKWRSEIGIGGVLIGSGRRHFYERFYDKKGYYQLTMDASRHDQNICEELLVGAFSILRAMFPKSGLIDRHFFFFASGHIHKRILMRDGFVYLVSGGIQTGDPATSLVNSIVMLLEKTILYKKLEIEPPVDRVYYGDDQFELFKQKPNLPDNFGELSRQITGVTQKDIILKRCDAPFSFDLSKEPSFLQIYFNKGSPLRNYDRVFEKLMYIDKLVRDKPLTKLEAVLSMGFTTFGDFRVIKLICDYANFIIKEYNLLYNDPMYVLFKKIFAVSIGNFSISTLNNARGEVGFVRKKRVTVEPDKYTGLHKIAIADAKKYSRIILGSDKRRNQKKIIKQIRKSGVTKQDLPKIGVRLLKQLCNMS
jgi:hypothetical protein